MPWISSAELFSLREQVATLKLRIEGDEKTIEEQIMKLEELQTKISGLEAVVEYAKNLHDTMFEIIRSFAPKAVPSEAFSPVGGVKSWNSIRKELERKTKEGS